MKSLSAAVMTASLARGAVHRDRLSPLTVEISVELGTFARESPWLGIGMLAIALVFVWRSFYSMRSPKKR